MSDNYITEPDIYDCEIEIVAEAFALKDKAIRSASSITTVENLFEANQAKSAMDQLTQLKKEVEASRKQAKEPALHIGRKIDSIAKDFSSEIIDEIGRLQKVLGEYQRIEREKQRKAEAEARRKAQEALDKANAEAEANSANTELQPEIAQKTDAAIAKINEEAASKHQAVKGLRVRKTLKFEIQDEQKLLESRPDLFSPDDSKIRAAIKLTQNIPGLEIWEETKAY